MTFAKCVCVVLLATLLVMVVRPARAEALEPVFISMIVSGAIVVIALVAILIIANMSEGRRRSSVEMPERAAPLVALDIAAPDIATRATQSP